MAQNEINIKNRRASFDYEFIEEYNAGIILTGTEIKSVRAGKASLVDSYCYFDKGELWVKGIHIAEYRLGTYYNHEEKRERKLLLTRKELRKLERNVKETGLTIVPTKMFLTEKGWVKLRIALARGKKEYDKRESLKLKDAKKDMDRAMKR
ncbi:MAG: SsrA-binding protein SmpB [Odoribacter sp.]|nr:SsrA-binding protein SmpB [Odoribacter sp.]MDE6879177.1 SsrA-binding protein SmpB [Odoribacter sp.]